MSKSNSNSNNTKYESLLVDRTDEILASLKREREQEKKEDEKDCFCKMFAYI